MDHHQAQFGPIEAFERKPLNGPLTLDPPATCMYDFTFDDVELFLEPDTMDFELFLACVSCELFLAVLCQVGLTPTPEGHGLTTPDT